MAKFIQVTLVKEQSGAEPWLNVEHILSVMDYEGETHITMIGDHPALKVEESVAWVMERLMQ